jgi:homoserine O-acetyltransferase/O-succinyltransferase
VSGGDTGSQHDVFELGDLELERGGVLRGARLLYKTHGSLGAAKDNAILYPHMFSGTPSSLESTIGPGRALDPARYFVICPGQLGNGFSSSPSNADGPFPDVLIGDDVVAQHRLVTEGFGIERLELVLGFSMGAQQSYEWAVRFPGVVARLAAIAGTARTTPHCALAVELAEAALLAGGLPLHARAWVPLGLSAELFRTEAWREAGFASVEDLVRRLFDEDFAPMHAGNLACQCRKWRRADVSRHAGGDLTAALAQITARAFVIPFSHDLLFPVADCAAEQRLIAGSELRVIESPWGHYAWEMTGSAREGLDQHLRELLERSPDPALD